MERRNFIANTSKWLTLSILGWNLLKENTLQAAPNLLFNKDLDENELIANALLPSNQLQTATYYSKGKEVKIHAIQTGLIAVKKNFLDRKGTGLFAKMNIAFSKKYADFMPIWIWLIEHEEGLILIDTGELETATRMDFYKDESGTAKFLLKAMNNKWKMSVEDEALTQLGKLNIKPEQIAKIAITHLHSDHTNGLKFFPNTEIIVPELEYKHPYSNMPTTYPKTFKPNLIQYSKDRVEGFKDAFALTKAEDIWLVPTPGHTHHHCSILFQTDKEHLLFAGDVSYYQQQLLDNRMSGSNIDYKKLKTTYQTILDYAQKYPTIYLPSHDINASKRLIDKELLIKNN